MDDRGGCGLVVESGLMTAPSPSPPAGRGGRGVERIRRSRHIRPGEPVRRARAPSKGAVDSGLDSWKDREPTSKAARGAQTRNVLHPHASRLAGRPSRRTREMPARVGLSPPRDITAQRSQNRGIAITISRSHGTARGRRRGLDRRNMRKSPGNRKNPWIARWIPRLRGVISRGSRAAPSSSAWTAPARSTASGPRPADRGSGPLARARRLEFVSRGRHSTRPALETCGHRGSHDPEGSVLFPSGMTLRPACPQGRAAPPPGGTRWP